MKVSDKVIVVTGGGNGIGREIVLTLLSRGAKVAAIDLNQSALEETLRLSGEHSSRLSIHPVNITDKALVESLPDTIISKHGTVDGLINNAGIIQPFVKFNDLELDIIKRVMDVNFYGTVSMLKAFLPHLLKRPEAHITNLSSMGGFFPVSGQAIYGASKAAVKLLTEGLSMELKDTSVGVSVVFPGGVNSNIMGNSGVQKSLKMIRLEKIIPLTTPKQAANRIVNGMEKNRYRIFVGIDSILMNVIYKFSPKTVVRWINRITTSLLMK